MWAPITSWLVGISLPIFSMGRDELLSTNKKVIARILTYTNCTNTVSWRKFIRHVVLWYSLSSHSPAALLREEFRIPKSTFHSDLRRRASSRLALPCTSSCLYCSSVVRLFVLWSRWTTSDHEFGFGDNRSGWPWCTVHLRGVRNSASVHTMVQRWQTPRSTQYTVSISSFYSSSTRPSVCLSVYSSRIFWLHIPGIWVPQWGLGAKPS